MKKPGHSLLLVTAALQGRLRDGANWSAILEIANRGWLGPALYTALRRSDQLDEIPPDIHDYLTLLYERNCERNQRLRMQLLEAIRALNRRNIEPILLKGAVDLFTADTELGWRIISDLDVSIAPFELEGARSALMALGYRDVGNVRELARPDDVGAIDIHDIPSARSAPYLSDDLRSSAPKAMRDGAVAGIPSPTSRALHLIVHDMIKEGDYWSLRIDLRHLHDLSKLASSYAGVDWQLLRAVLSDRTGRRALIVQARALDHLFGVKIPSDLRPGRLARLRHVSRLVAANRNIAGTIVRLMGDLSLGVNRIAVGYSWQGGRTFANQVKRTLASNSRGSRL